MSIENRKVLLYCPICGNDQLSCENITYLDDLSKAPDEITLKCSDCGKIFTKGELIESNQDIINANLEDINQKAIKEIEKEFSRMFKKRGNKWTLQL